MFKKDILLILSIFLSFSFLIAQEQDTLPPEIRLTTISQVNQGNSYITFLGGLGNMEPLLYEANLIPNFYIRKIKESRLMGVFTPQIILRMYQEFSSPIKTPSYMPQITLYYRFGETNRLGDYTIFGRFAHHSNGQDGNFFLEDGSINTDSGDFTTNYVELGVIKTDFNRRFNAVHFFRTSIQINPPAWSSKDLQGIFPFYRWHFVYSIFKLPHDKEAGQQKKASISLKGRITWLFGDLNDWPPLSINRLNFSLTFNYHPKFFEDIGFFIQYYHGFDYYNIHFETQLRVLRVGIMTEILRF